MPTDLPIACSLGAADLDARLRTIADLGRDALTGRRLDGASATLRFAGRPGVRERVEAIVAAEAQCCAFLAMSVRDERDAVVLSIDAPAGAEPVLAELVAAFGEVRRPGLGRLNP